MTPAPKEGRVRGAGLDQSVLRGTTSGVGKHVEVHFGLLRRLLGFDVVVMSH
jgi:hypothetical protein